MATNQPVRFLVQHCLQQGAVLLEMVPSSFADVANRVLTNGGKFSPIEVSGLTLEAFQPEFQDWIAARSIDDLMACRKLRVVGSGGLVEVAAASPAPAFAAHMPPAPELAPPPTFVQPQQAQYVHAAPVAVNQPPQAQPPALNNADTVSVGMQDVLLAIGSLPRSVEPSCSNVLEHLARHRVPALGLLVEAGLQQCGHPTGWQTPRAVPPLRQPAPVEKAVLGVAPPAPVPAPAPAVVAKPASIEKRKVTERVPEKDLQKFKTLFTERTVRNSFICAKIGKEMPDYKKPERRKLLIDAAIRRGLVKESNGPKGLSDNLLTIQGKMKFATALDAKPAATAASNVAASDQQQHQQHQKVMNFFKKISTVRSKDIMGSLKGGIKDEGKRKGMILAAVKAGLIKGVGTANPGDMHDSYTIVTRGSNSQASQQQQRPAALSELPTHVAPLDGGVFAPSSANNAASGDGTAATATWELPTWQSSELGAVEDVAGDFDTAKRSREEQDRHPADDEDALSQRRKRDDDVARPEGGDATAAAGGDASTGAPATE